MRDQIDADRKQKIQEALLGANTGCLLNFPLLFGLPIVGIGGFFVYLGLNKMHEQAQLNDVVISVPATIDSSEVRQSTTKTGPDVASTTTSYWAEIEFTYEHDGKEQKSNRVWPIGEGGNEEDILAIVERYPPDAQVMVFVDSEDPGRAFLEKRWSQMPYVSVSIGCLPAVFVTALCVLVAGWKRPGIAMLSSLVVGVIVIFLTVLAGEHYLRNVPPSDRVWWMWLVLAGSCVLVLGLMAAVIKARWLNRLYLEATEAAESS